MNEILLKFSRFRVRKMMTDILYAYHNTSGSGIPGEYLQPHRIVLDTVDIQYDWILADFLYYLPVLIRI